MRLFRPRFSMKMMLVAVTLAAIGSFVLVLPTVRAQRFARFINAGECENAEAMLPETMRDTSLHRHTIQRAVGATVMPLTTEQLLSGERRVVVTESHTTFGRGSKADEPVTAEYIVRRTTISDGWHSFFVW